MCIRDSQQGAVKVGAAADAFLFEKAVAQQTYRMVLSLSLIHISEPTRPY